MTVVEDTTEPVATKKPKRSKAEQIIDLLADMPPSHVKELADKWVDREPEQFDRFQRALREMAENDDPRVNMKAE